MMKYCRSREKKSYLWLFQGLIKSNNRAAVQQNKKLNKAKQIYKKQMQKMSTFEKKHFFVPNANLHLN